MAQKEKIEQTFGVCRLVYNLALETKIIAYKNAGVRLSSFDLCYQLVALKREYRWMTEVDSQALQASVKKIDSAFKGFFNGKGYPKFKSKHGRQSFQCPTGVRNIYFEKGMLTIPKLPNIPIRISKTFIGKIKTITISRGSSGKYFASVLVETNDNAISKPAISSSKTVGIDLGIKSFVVTSNGKTFEPNRFLKSSLQRLRCLQKRASRKKKGSRNKKKANLRVSLLHEKIKNQRTDYIHKVTTGLIRDSQAETFVIENLNVVGMLKNDNLSQAISDVSFGEFVRQLKYKADWYGKNIIQIGRFEPSSKMCNNCKSINETLTLSDREWSCASCGVLHDRDLNAAKNIRDMGLNKISGVGNPGEPVEKRRLRCSKKQELFF